MRVYFEVNGRRAESVIGLWVRYPVGGERPRRRDWSEVPTGVKDAAIMASKGYQPANTVN